MRSIYTVAIAHSFGSGSKRPFHAAIARLSMFGIAAATMSLLVGHGLQKLPLSPVPHAWLLACPASVVVQAAAVCSLVIAMGIMRVDMHERFIRLLLIWPLTARTRWALYMLPSLILVLLSTLLVAWPLAVALTQLGLAVPLIIAAFIAGCATALALVQSVPRNYSPLLLAWIPCNLWLEYAMLTRIGNASLPLHTRGWYAAALASVFALLIALALRTVKRLTTTLTTVQSQTHNHRALPPAVWFLAKLLRSPSSRISFVGCLAISLFVSIGARRQGATEPAAISLIGALLAASFATDIRARARRVWPAEITALRGSLNFVGIYLLHAFLGCMLAISPIIFTLTTLPYHWSLATGLHTCLQLSIGICAGASAGSILVPEGRDISSQFTAGIIVLAILFAAPQLSSLQHLPLAWRNITDGIVIAVLLVIIFAIEYKRNPFFWRQSHA
ncbi:MAG TPA: hypothetical protein VLE73_02575 [Candidatus Saccharimonadales bacterium]|nr:hypothetical protein [Candidatus Saccharimonadales bacterium]